MSETIIPFPAPLNHPVDQAPPPGTVADAPCPLESLTFSAKDIEAFSGRAAGLPRYDLYPLQDQGAQYELAMDFDDDDLEDTSDPKAIQGDEPVNPFYGIPFGVCMLVAKTHGSDRPAGFMTFRRELQRQDRLLHYDLKMFVFMVRADLRGLGYGSALAMGAIQALRRDIHKANPEKLNLRFLGEGKTSGGTALLNRTAKSIATIQRDFFSTSQDQYCRIAAHIT